MDLGEELPVTVTEAERHISKPDDEAVALSQEALDRVSQEILHFVDEGGEEFASITFNPLTQEVFKDADGDGEGGILALAVVFPYKKRIDEEIGQTQIPLACQVGGRTYRLPKMPVYVIVEKEKGGGKTGYIVKDKEPVADKAVVWRDIVDKAEWIVPFSRLSMAARDPVGELEKDLRESVKRGELTKEEMDETLAEARREDTGSGAVGAACPFSSENKPGAASFPEVTIVKDLDRLDEDGREQLQAVLKEFLPSILLPIEE